MSSMHLKINLWLAWLFLYSTYKKTKQKLTWEKYAGNTQRWSSNREHWTRSSNSKRSCVVPRKRSGVVVSNGGDFGTPIFGWLPATHAPTCWRLEIIKQHKFVEYSHHLNFTQIVCRWSGFHEQKKNSENKLKHAFRDSKFIFSEIIKIFN